MQRKTIIGLAIVLFWLLMMGSLLRRELSVGLLTPRTVSTSAFPTESWMAIELVDGPRVGQVHMQGDLETRDGVAGQRFSLEAELNLRISGKATDLRLEGEVWRSQEPPRADFRFQVISGGHDFDLTGEVEEGELRAEVGSAGETLPLVLPMSEDILFSNGLGTALDFPVLEEGEELRVDSFDPLTLSKGRARIRYLSRETLELDSGPIETRRLRVDMGGIESFAWIDDTGQVVRAETPVGLVLQRLDGPGRDLARAEDARSRPAGDFLRLSAISPTGPRPFRGASSLRFQLSGIEERELPVDQTQSRVAEDLYLVEPVGAPEAELPGASSEARESLRAFLRSDAFVQSEHPEIQAKAREIVDEEQDPWQRALLLHDWVFTYLEKEAVMSVPSALEVLAQRRGDCNEHTVLFAALARALDLPTRIAIGLVWSDELDGFYYHAWPEVHLGAGWVWMDPTLDQPIADATHIKLLNGGIETWPQLLPFLGQLELEILSIDGEPQDP